MSKARRRYYKAVSPVEREYLMDAFDALPERDRAEIKRQAERLSEGIPNMSWKGALEILYQVGTNANRDIRFANWLTNKLAGDETLAGELDALRAG